MRHVTSPIWGAPVADPGEGSGGSAPLKNFFGDRAPLLSQGLEDRPHPPPPLSEGLDPPLCPTSM